MAIDTNPQSTGPHDLRHSHRTARFRRGEDGGDAPGKGALDYTVVVDQEGNDPAGLAWIAPYAATSIAVNTSWKPAATC